MVGEEYFDSLIAALDAEGRQSSPPATPPAPVIDSMEVAKATLTPPGRQEPTLFYSPIEGNALFDGLFTADRH